MDNEMHKYEFRNHELNLPRQWVPIEELKEIAVGIGFPAHDNLPEVLQEQGIDIKGDQADFTGVNLSLLENGLISGAFLKTIIDSNFQQDFIGVNSLMQLFKDLGFEKLSQPKQPSKDEVSMVVSALKELAI